jgi:hypothetical protein
MKLTFRPGLQAQFGAAGVRIASHAKARTAATFQRRMKLLARFAQGYYGPLRWGLAADIARHEGWPYYRTAKDVRVMLGKRYENFGKGPRNQWLIKHGCSPISTIGSARDKGGIRGIHARYMWKPVPGGIRPPALDDPHKMGLVIKRSWSNQDFDECLNLFVPCLHEEQVQAQSKGSCT